MIYFDDVCFFRLDRGRVGIRVAVLAGDLLPVLEADLAGDLLPILLPDFELVFAGYLLPDLEGDWLPDLEGDLLPDLEGDLGGDAELCCTRSSRIRSRSMSSYEDCW